MRIFQVPAAALHHTAAAKAVAAAAGQRAHAAHACQLAGGGPQLEEVARGAWGRLTEVGG